MGVAGAGKSVQGRLLADTHGWPWLSTGEFLRMLISGEKRKAMAAGKLLDDQEIISLVRRALSLVDTDQEFVLDGFPRTVAQADWLLSQIKHGQLKATAVIHLKASSETVEKRLLSRGRQDDNQEAISERLREYKETIMPILNELKNSGIKIIEVDGEKSVDSVQAAIIESLNL